MMNDTFGIELIFRASFQDAFHWCAGYPGLKSEAITGDAFSI